MYDDVGNLITLIYPDRTCVHYTYNANNNLITVTDWSGRKTTYTYDENNQVIGIKKPDGSTTVTVYDDHQRVISTVERSRWGKIISGYEFTYGPMGRIEIEKDIANNIQMSYTYDDLCRVCNRRTANLNTGRITDESFTLDAAGNILDDHNFEYYYSANNQLQECTEYCLEYDEDGNMTYSFVNYEDTYYTFDSRNRLVSDGIHTYTYNAENTRIRSTCDGVTTYYTYNTNAKLSQLLHKQTQGVVTKYVYGLGLIGEEKQGEFKTYHFDYRGSTVAIIDGYGAITDTFRYDTYGKLINRTGETDTPFLFNGRDGVMTEDNGLYYMRARYYSPDLRRFINADIVAGEISNSPTLNRYAYANGNPVSFVDPLGLSAERGTYVSPLVDLDWSKFTDGYFVSNETISFLLNDDSLDYLHSYLIKEFNTTKRPDNIGIGTWNKGIQNDIDWVNNVFGKSSKIGKALKAAPYISVGIDASVGIYNNITQQADWQITVADAVVDVGFGLAGVAIGAAIGSIIPGAGTVAGAVVGAAVGLGVDLLFYGLTEVITIQDKSIADWTSYGISSFLYWLS